MRKKLCAGCRGGGGQTITWPHQGDKVAYGRKNIILPVLHLARDQRARSCEGRELVPLHEHACAHAVQVVYGRVDGLPREQHAFAQRSKPEHNLTALNNVLQRPEARGARQKGKSEISLVKMKGRSGHSA